MIGVWEARPSQLAPPIPQTCTYVKIDQAFDRSTNHHIKMTSNRASTIFRKTNANLSTSWEAKQALRDKAKYVSKRARKEEEEEAEAEAEAKGRFCFVPKGLD